MAAVLHSQDNYESVFFARSTCQYVQSDPRTHCLTAAFATTASIGMSFRPTFSARMALENISTCLFPLGAVHSIFSSQAEFLLMAKCLGFPRTPLSAPLPQTVAFVSAFSFSCSGRWAGASPYGYPCRVVLHLLGFSLFLAGLLLITAGNDRQK